MYHVSAQGLDERVINVYYYYYETSGPLLVSSSEPIWIGCQSDPACLLGMFKLSQVREKPDFLEYSEALTSLLKRRNVVMANICMQEQFKRH